MVTNDFIALDRDHLIEEFATVVQSYLDEIAFLLPLHVCVIGRNGSTYVIRLSEGREGFLDPKLLAAHEEGGMFSFPINLMIADSVGKAARVVIVAAGVHQLIH